MAIPFMSILRMLGLTLLIAQMPHPACADFSSFSNV